MEEAALARDPRRSGSREGGGGCEPYRGYTIMSGKRRDKYTIAVAERRLKALAYRKAGAPYRQIAETLNTSHPTIIRDIQVALAELAEQQRAEAGELRTLENARLDSLQVAVWQQAINGSLKAIGMVLRIMERRARLNGLDAQPGAELPTELSIILRWHDDRRIIDATPIDHHVAPTPQIAESDSTAPGAVQMRVRWSEMGQVETGGDALSENGA